MFTRFVNLIPARVAVFIILSGSAILAHFARLMRRMVPVKNRHRPVGQLRLLIAGTFYNENWFRSHILPLSQAASFEHIYVVTDQPLFECHKVRYICPPHWAQRCFGRTLTRVVAVFYGTLRYGPDMLMGYHIMPNALICLIAASMLGKRSAYQMTGGPTQIMGGGVGSENILLRRLGRPSRILEKLLYHLVRLFDVVVVRGRHSREFTAKYKLARRTAVVSGSVDTKRFHPNGHQKNYDLVMVGRHIEDKQPHLFLDIVAQIRQTRPEVSAALAGDGPLTEDLHRQARRLGIEDNIHFLGKVKNVDQVLAESKIFVLTSRNEGLSIAMVEAMAAGLPVITSNVGDLSELLVHNESGLFIEPRQVVSSARVVSGLLDDRARLRAMSTAARKRAVHCNSVAAVARRWDSFLENTLFG